MIYDIRHVTSYSYESPVSFARCSLRLEPRSGDGQQLLSHSVDIRPKPADRTVRRDFFGTLTESILIETAHRNLRIDSRSRVAVSRQAPNRAAPKSGLGERPRRRIRGRQPRPGVADRLRLCEPFGAGAAAGHRLRGGELSAR